MRWVSWFLAAIMASFALVPITVMAAGTSTGAWTTVAPMPTPRFALAAATGSDGRVYAIGGENGDTVLSTVEAFDPGADAWSRVAPMPTARAALAAVVGKDGRIYVIGGRTGNPCDGSRVALNTVEALTVSPASGAVLPEPCQFVLGFKSLHDMLPSTVGSCTDDEGHNPANGDALQHTSGGLLFWRKADNWTAFTDGYHTWVNGPNGLQERLNTQRFRWEANPDGLPMVG